MKKIKLCIDCKYIKEHLEKCLRPHKYTGLPIETFINYERKRSILHEHCGPNARFFVHKKEVTNGRS